MAYHPENEISTIEDLDPEPQPRGGFVRWREVALGLLLLAGVLGWAGWQWWQQNLQASNYTAGVQAESLKHYDQALKYFRAASGYRDADVHASNDTQLIFVRNGYYSSAVGDGMREEWIPTLTALQSVRRVQPDYLNTPDLYAETEAHVYADAVQGLVAMRTEATPPGLYYRTSSGWVYLKGSDRFSQVRSEDSPDAAVYDVPGPGWKADPAGGLTGRDLKVARFSDVGVTFDTLNLDPVDYAGYELTTNGVLAFRKFRPTGQIVPIGYLLPYVQADYEPFASLQTTTVLPTTLMMNAAQQGLLDYSRSTGQVLLASWGGISLRESNIDLVVGNPQDSSTKHIYSLSGDIGSAQFSPDSRYVFVTTIQPSKSDNSINNYAALLLRTDGVGSPTTFLTTTLPVQSSGAFIYEPSSIVGTFITHGPFKGMILTSVVDSTTTTISLRDPSALDTPLISTKIQGYAEAQQVQLSEGGQELIISGVKGALDFLDLNSLRPFVVSLIPGYQYAETDLPQDMNSSITSADLKSGFLLYATSVYSPVNYAFTSEVDTLFSFPEMHLGQLTVQPRELLTATSMLNADDGSVNSIRFWYTGKGALSYVQSGSLYARTYDGTASVNLETGVPALYDISRRADTLYLR